VTIPAEEPDHGVDGLSLPFDPGVGLRHEVNIMRPAPDGKGIFNPFPSLDAMTHDGNAVPLLLSYRAGTGINGFDHHEDQVL
jgi:hypothetical protein